MHSKEMFKRYLNEGWYVARHNQSAHVQMRRDGENGKQYHQTISVHGELGKGLSVMLTKRLTEVEQEIREDLKRDTAIAEISDRDKQFHIDCVRIFSYDGSNLSSRQAQELSEALRRSFGVNGLHEEELHMIIERISADPAYEYIEKEYLWSQAEAIHLGLSLQADQTQELAR
jgi:predicted RNA binding protein YcfA (HicA-like mRNA interferase family)